MWFKLMAKILISHYFILPCNALYYNFLKFCKIRRVVSSYFLSCKMIPGSTAFKNYHFSLSQVIVVCTRSLWTTNRIRRNSICNLTPQRRAITHFGVWGHLWHAGFWGEELLAQPPDGQSWLCSWGVCLMLLCLSFPICTGRRINMLLCICFFIQLHCIFVKAERICVKRLSS